MEGQEEEGGGAEEACQLEAADDGAVGEEGGEISLHALEGCPSEKIIKVKGSVGKRRVMKKHHSFLDEDTALNL